jgi:ribosomal protein S18
MNEQHGTARDYNDIAKSTIRQHTENVDRYGNTGMNEQRGTARDYNDIAKPTIRQNTENNERNGIITGDAKSGIAIDYNNIAKLNKKILTEHITDIMGNVTGDVQKMAAIDYKDIAKLNKKILTEHITDIMGNITGDAQKLAAIDYKDIAKLNKKILTEQIKDIMGNITGNGQKNIAVDYNDIAKLNKKIFTETADRNGAAGAGSGNEQKGYTINYDLFTPDLTRREIHSKLDRAAGGLGAGVKPRTRDDANNSYVNIEREVIAKGRAPTKSNFIKGPTYDNTCVALREQIPINREYAPSSIITISDKLPFTMHTPTGRMVANTRINQFTELSLEQNPFINNVVHKSVSY